MNILSNSKYDPQRNGYSHASKQQGWSDNSYHASRTLEEADYLSDDEYHDRLGVHNPLWRYVINRYRDEFNTPIMVLGKEALPLAIELSQWTYPTSLVVKNEKERKKAISDSQRQAGNFTRIVIDGERFIRSRIAIMIGIIDSVPVEKAKKTIDHLLEGVNVVICAVKRNRDWSSIFGNKIKYGLRYYHGEWLMLVITK